MEETRGIGQIQAQSLLDQEMAEMSPNEKMTHLQSRMHFDESMESNADSDLEDGEIRKLLTSSLCAQRASGRPDAMDIRTVRQMHERLIHQKVGELPGDRSHCFHQDVMKKETTCGVQCSVELYSEALKITCWVKQGQI